jgi:hypothetical protein
MPAPRKRNSPHHKQSPAPSKAQPTRRVASSAPAPVPEVVDPRWLLSALGIVFGVALLLSWGTLCLLYYQGQWQLVLHPSRVVSTTPASVGLAFTPVRFGPDVTGQPQLSGWYIPARLTSMPTVLMLHGADGSESAALPEALTLHNADLNVLLFDYRGYGASTGQHPSESSMQQDAEAALNYLTSTLRNGPSGLIVYGQGLGASLAVQLSAQHQQVSAVILDAPDGDFLNRAAHDPRSRLVPARLLFNQTFPLAAPLGTLRKPKLLISYGNTAPPALANAADPKVTLELPSSDDPRLVPAIQRFVDEQLHGVPSR